ncbi:lipopolysaccharide kinase InaA family protein [Geoalkalibacter subterraneus]|uniref:lipopolysaccharide kinase InaA family protein n=1 Tax=Geoalkalibacter subterraneus TaxID=483547 RepID=UPI000693B968|nr:lipopolysaccharide kinase InaA family protein [Geoalkalibacter subterraneus]
MFNNKKAFWNFLGASWEQDAFGSMKNTLQQTGEKISSDPLSSVVRTTVAGQHYYIKQYHRRGKKLRRFLGRSRAQGEWQNLQYFAELGIPIPRLVAFGRQSRLDLAAKQQINQILNFFGAKS